MKRPITMLVLLSLLLGAFAIPAFADEHGELVPLSPAPSAGTGEPTIELTENWFVELNSPPLADGGSMAAVARDKANFRTEARAAGLQFQERFAFDTLWNGISVSISPSQVGKLSMLPGVKAIYPVGMVSLPPEIEVSPELATALAMTGADVVQSELGLSGEGIRVAIIDTGIDYNHPDLGDSCFGPGCRVETGFDFVGDDFNAADPANNIPMPDPDPMDCNGHGTHVSGIVGADAASPEGVTGVAPGVTFGAYKVFGCVGSTFFDIVIAAMEMALEDNMDIINMSLGSAFQWPQHPAGQASDRLVKQGVVVVASIGNSGANGVYSSSVPGVAKDVIGVASFDNTHVQLQVFDIEGQQIGYIPMSGSPPPPTSGTEEIVFIGRACNEDLPLLDDPSGKVALAERGVCTFREKALNAIAAGATAVVIHNNVAGHFAGTVGAPPLDVPVVGISQADGLFIRGLTPPVFMTWTDERGTFPNPTGGLISSFSSYGLAPDLSLKPDIGAPGGSIFSTFPLALGGYATLSGTSMSSPHVAGGAALLLEAFPDTSAGDVRDILLNSGEPALWWGNPALGFLDNVHRQGAGMMRIDNAILTTTSATPGKLSLGASDGGQLTGNIQIRNTSSSPVSYSLSHAPALSTGLSTFSPSFFTGFASLDFSRSEFTVQAGAAASVRVRVTPNPALPDRSQYGGYIVITGDNGDVVRVPYAGFKGDYQSILVLNPAASEFGNPILRPTLTFGPSVPVTFNPDAGEVAWILVHLDHQVNRLLMEVFDAHTGRAWHRAFDLQFVARNSTATAFFAFAWDGTTMSGQRLHEVPSGDYVIRLTAVKALGSGQNPAHTETWTSPVITIERP